MTWKVGDFLVSGDANRRVFSKDNGSAASMKAFSFGLMAFFCLFALALMSVFAGKNADNVFSPKHNHVGFLWAVLSGAMLVILPVYLALSYNPPLVIEFHCNDQSVRSGGSIITRFDKIEYFQIVEDRDNDGQRLHRLVLFYGDGRELPIERSYDGAGVWELAREMSEFCGARVRSRVVSIVT